MQAIYGINPVREFLQADPTGIEEIIIARGRGGKEILDICNLANKAGITVTFKDRSEIEKIVGRVAHQGVVGLWAGFRYASLEEVMANRRPEMDGDVIVIADGVMDPHNLGAIVRTAYTMGANGLIIPAHRAAEVTGTVIKSSAGAIRYLPVAKEPNLARVIEALKRKNYWVYAAEAGAQKGLEEMDFSGSVAVIVGGEGQGIRRLLRKKSDFLFAIPMVGYINSLNVSVATGIILYRIFSSLRKM
jgi:23S rRNA (guanosine2251-2'-O)-methyltransferase